MGGVAGIVAPVFAVIALGAGARHWRLMDAAGLRGITDLTFYAGLPALLFSSVVEAQSFSLLDVAVLYFAMCLVVFCLGIVLARRLLGAGLAQATMVGLNSCFGNTGMLALPLIAAAFGADGIAVLLPIIALHSLLLLPIATMLIEADGRGTANPWRILGAVVPALVRNPMLVAIAAAFAWRMLAIPVPVPLHRLLAMLAGAAPTMALFALGGTLPGMAARGNLRETGLATTLKLVVLPSLVWAAAHWAGLGPLQTAVAVVTAGTPTGANAFFLARRTQVSTESSAGTVVAATALSVVTLTVLLTLLGH